MDSSFFQWLAGFSAALFCERTELLLSFVGIGMAIVVYALTQTAPLFDEAILLNEQILNARTEERESNSEEIVQYQAKRHYWKFIVFVNKAGTMYFPSACFLALLITYPSPLTTPPSLLYKLLSNLSYFLLLVPTALISGYYIYYRLFVFRIHI